MMLVILMMLYNSGERTSKATKAVRAMNMKRYDDQDDKQSVFGRKIYFLVGGPNIELSSSNGKGSRSRQANVDDKTLQLYLEPTTPERSPSPDTLLTPRRRKRGNACVKRDVV